MALQVTVESSQAGQRLDILTSELLGITRSQASSQIKSGNLKTIWDGLEPRK